MILEFRHLGLMHALLNRVSFRTVLCRLQSLAQDFLLTQVHTPSLDPARLHILVKDVMKRTLIVVIVMPAVARRCARNII